MSSQRKRSNETVKSVSSVSEDDEELYLAVNAVKIVHGPPSEREEERFDRLDKEAKFNFLKLKLFAPEFAEIQGQIDRRFDLMTQQL